MERRKGEPKVGKGSAWFPPERGTLAEAYHDAYYAIFLKGLEEMLQKNLKATARLDRALLAFRKALFANVGK